MVCLLEAGLMNDVRCKTLEVAQISHATYVRRLTSRHSPAALVQNSDASMAHTVQNGRHKRVMY